MKISEKPTWTLGAQKARPKLKKDIMVDVAIAGGGLAGILDAYILTEKGKKVAVFEAKKLGSEIGATLYTTAFITQVVDTSLGDLIKMFGAKNAKLVWQSGEAAIKAIENIIKKENIDCEFERCSAYVYAANEREYEKLEEEHEVARRLGFKTALRNASALPFKNYGFLEVKNQAKFHPIKFLYALARKVEANGGKIFEQSRVSEVSEGPWRGMKVGDHKVIASDVIVATYAPFNNPKETHYKKGMYGSYVLEAHLKKGLLTSGIYWDQHNPYHYFRIDPQGKFDRMILGGEDHREELPINKKKSFKALEEYLDGLLGGKPYQITRKWTGPVLEPSDGLALIGAYKPHQFVATAFSGNGMTYSMISAILFRDIIAKKKNPWGAVYDPTRKLTAYRLAKKAVDYAGEFFGAAVKNTLRFK